MKMMAHELFVIACYSQWSDPTLVGNAIYDNRVEAELECHRQTPDSRCSFHVVSLDDWFDEKVEIGKNKERRNQEGDWA